MTRPDVLEHALARPGRSITELKQFLRFPSVSSQPGHARDVRRCARWLAEHLRRIGLPDVRVIPTRRHPIVYASWCGAPGRPSVLIYGHYDVQPPEPLAEWRTAPFEPVVRGGSIYARGASDDKGQLFTHIKAIEAYLHTAGRLPVNVRCLFEGEEEIGSPNLLGFVKRNQDLLSCDTAVISDTAMPAEDRPALIFGLRGGLSLEMEVTGPAHDLHSGSFGGAIHNPLQVLCEILAGLHDPDGRVAIPGFYDSVRPVSATARERTAEAAPMDEEVLLNARAPRGWGEPGYTLHERVTIRPALTINGLCGGHCGPGGKGIIPARAIAKLSFRLVPDQDPHHVERLLRQTLSRRTPPTVGVSLRRLSAAFPVVLDRRHPVFRAAARAYEAGFGASPAFLRSGGTIPVVHAFQTILGIPTALVGFGLPDDRIHSPNEHFRLRHLFQGIATSIELLSQLGEFDETRTMRWKRNQADEQVQFRAGSPRQFRGHGSSAVPGRVAPGDCSPRAPADPEV